ncbi:unnamed protein product [Angiostrongylus costaricensis]|uniref:N(4)-(Beta-N-acetylglucosaminyl)-L-asparaginase n=1 Tax=Angiostrongylus costaricensis TaxID=334426 RepID=A0A0R3PU56_ANGCS|nr:unnamed protein product [Angiostrongylus costaricensis]
MGFKEENLSTTFSHNMFLEWRNNSCQPNFWRNVVPDPTKTCGPYHPKNHSHSSSNSYVTSIDSNGWVHRYRFHHDTIGMVVVDSAGSICAGTSSNGARFKLNSPIPGAGAYAVDGVGGAAATGDGDVMIRFMPSFFVVEQMRLGTKPYKATHKAIKRILDYYPKFQGAVVGVNSNGTYGAACANMENFMFSIGEASKTRTESVACITSSSRSGRQKKSKTT